MNLHATDHSNRQAPITAVNRRGVLKLSLASALGTLLGPTVPRAFGSEAAAAAATNEKSVILLWLQGGPYQGDMFDPHDSSDDKLALKYKPMKTTADGLHLASCMPRLAQQAKHLTLIRSMNSEEREHSLAQYYMQTGYRPIGGVQAPALGSIVSHELGGIPMKRADGDGLPPYISIGHKGWSAGYFGAPHQPYIIWDPDRNPDNLGLPASVTDEALARRLAMLKSIEDGRASTSYASELAAGRESALRFMRSKNRQAFDLAQEPDTLRDVYGRSKFGQGCLLARRLVASGVRFVQVFLENFDHHAGHYEGHERLIPQVDQGMAALVADLADRAMLEHTVVICAGEFGRTPRMNEAKGRDHWSTGWSIALAGGGFKRGYVYGATKDGGQEIADNPVTIPDFMATLCQDLGINADAEYYDSFDRPLKLVDKGKIVRDLLA